MIDETVFLLSHVVDLLNLQRRGTNEKNCQKEKKKKYVMQEKSSCRR